MKRTVENTKNPLENINRRSVLGVLGVGMTGVFVACNDDVSPLKLNLKSDISELTVAGSITLTATVLAGLADKIDFYETSPSSATDRLIWSLSASALNAQAQVSNALQYTSNDNGTHTYYCTITSVTGKEANSNPIVVKVNIASTQPPTLPTIGLASSSTALTAPGKITLTATVSNGTVSQVEFFDGATSIGMGTLTGSAYTLDFQVAATPASHSFTAKGTSAAGIATSNPVTVTLNISLPTISLASSSNNITAAGNITLTASIAGGTVSKVEFFEGTTLLGVANVSPYTNTIAIAANAPSGTRNYTARGTVTGATTTVDSTLVAVVVNIGNVAPTISLTSSSLSVTANGNITLTATATAKTGSISTVEFFDGTTSLGIVNAAPFTFPMSFTAAKNGTHNYTAKATDLNGNSATSTPAVAVTVAIPTAAPTVTLASSSSNVTAAGSVTLTATPTPAIGVTITKVDFFEGTTLLGTKTAAPYIFAPAYTAANNGTHTYTALATDSSTKTGTSTSVGVLVNIASTPPTISLASSSLNITAAGSITLKATVMAGTGTISKVELFEGSSTTALGQGTLSGGTYNFAAIAFTSANNGTHNYTTKVTASDGSTVTSTPVTAVVVNITATAGTLIALYTALSATGSYVNFNHPTSGIKCILYRAPTAQAGGVTSAGAYYVAYSRKCTHAGTIITNNPNTATPHVLKCQDHGALYNMDSNCAPIPNSQQNAPAPLPSITITAGTDGIYI